MCCRFQCADARLCANTYINLIIQQVQVYNRTVDDEHDKKGGVWSSNGSCCMLKPRPLRIAVFQTVDKHFFKLFSGCVHLIVHLPRKQREAQFSLYSPVFNNNDLFYRDYSTLKFVSTNLIKYLCDNNFHHRSQTPFVNQRLSSYSYVPNTPLFRHIIQHMRFKKIQHAKHSPCMYCIIYTCRPLHYF